MSRLIVISSEKDIEDELKIVHQLFDEGMEIYHLRKPHWTIFQMLEFLKKIDFKHLNKISLHDHHTLVKAFDLKYVHFKKAERTYFSTYLQQKREFIEKKRISLSSSFKSIEEITPFAHNLKYCFLSPVFDSISKKGYKQGIPPDLCIPKNVSTNVIALGGVKRENIESVFERGFHGAAVLGAVWKNPSKAVENFKAIRNICPPSDRTH